MSGTDFRPEQGPPQPRRSRGRRRRGPKIIAGVCVLAAVGAAAAATQGLGGGGTAGGAAANELPPETAQVARQTLKDTKSVDGELAYGKAKPAAARLAGTLTQVPAAGAKITRGKALYEVDDQPVILFYGSLPAYRALKTGDEGADVEQLERNLSALGYAGFTVDEEYSHLTAQAVKAWQEDLDLKETGTVELGRVAFAPGPVRVDAVEAAPGDQTGPGQKVLTYTGTGKAVTLELDTDDQRLAKKGTEVLVRFPDGSTAQGTITAVATVLQPAEQQKEAETKIEVLVGLKQAEARKAAKRYDQAGVHVDFTAGERKNVLTVPVAALLALAEGGFGVEVVDGSSTKYVTVSTGLFAGGRVEISGSGIAEGTRVGMPK